MAKLALAVAGAHLSGLGLNHQLVELGAQLVRTTRTAPVYSKCGGMGTWGRGHPMARRWP